MTNETLDTTRLARQDITDLLIEAAKKLNDHGFVKGWDVFRQKNEYHAFLNLTDNPDPARHHEGLVLHVQMYDAGEERVDMKLRLKDAEKMRLLYSHTLTDKSQDRQVLRKHLKGNEHSFHSTYDVRVNWGFTCLYHNRNPGPGDRRTEAECLADTLTAEYTRAKKDRSDNIAVR